MIRFGKTTDYALLALMHLVGTVSGVASARQIASSVNIPLPLLSKILKCLHHNGLLDSTRGSRGGYRIRVDLREVSIEHLMHMLRGGSAVHHRPSEPPLQALHSKIVRSLGQIKLSDLVIPGRRIDVPVESVGLRRASARVNVN